MADPSLALQFAGVVVITLATGPSVLVIMKLIIVSSLQSGSEIVISYDPALRLSAVFPLLGILGDH